MNKNGMSIKIGGEAGQGVESSGAGFARAVARGGLHIFGMQDYYSRIRGGHNYFSIRVSEEPLYSHTEHLDLLIALTQEAVERHCEEIVDGGAILCEECLDVPCDTLGERSVSTFPIPLTDIAKESGGSEVMRNTAALAASAGLVEYDLTYVESVIRDNFARKGQAVVDANLRTASAAFDYARKTFAGDFGYRLSPVPSAPTRMILDGNVAIALGALLGGCNFVAGYPMTPATSVLQWMAAHGNEYGVVVKHTEDEIAAIMTAIGAAHVGARSLVPTSGGGFALMVEGLSLAGMTETPVVIVEAQRPGPATGLATRTEQGDLLFMLRGGHGEFLRLILAPGSIEECFDAGWRSFNLADQYQSPVIVATDNFLANSIRTVDIDALDFGTVRINRGKLLNTEELDRLEDPYMRYAMAGDGVSPRALPGHPNAVYVATGNEHTPNGHLTEEPAQRTQQVAKRLRKAETALKEMRSPVAYGPSHASLVLVCWGSTYGPLREAVDLLNGSGRAAQLVHFHDIWPFPAEAASKALRGAQRLILVEGNATAQMGQIIAHETGVRFDQHILKWDGRPFSPEEIVRALDTEENNGRGQ